MLGAERSIPHERARIVHVTESLAAGVMEMLIRLTTEQAALGAVVKLVYSRRAETPSPEQLDSMFHPAVIRLEVSGAGPFRAALALFAGSWKVLRNDPDAIVHAHSSIAGAIVRIAAMVTAQTGRVFYSPHGFSFLRTDRSPFLRFAFKTAERVLVKGCAALILVSGSERKVAVQSLGRGTFHTMENAIDLDSLPQRTEQMSSRSTAGPPVDRRMRIATSGRITHQKAPWRFAELSTEFSDRAEFVWIGDGPGADREKWLSRAPLTVTGWLDHKDVLEVLSGCDVFVLLSLWEGMPLALIEAQCLGIPSIVTDVVGSRDVVLHGISGYIANTQDDVNAFLDRILLDHEVRGQLSEGASAQRNRFDQHRLGPESLGIYAGHHGATVVNDARI